MTALQMAASPASEYLTSAIRLGAATPLEHRLINEFLARLRDWAPNGPNDSDRIG